ncbi:hypothetical protein F5Y17DRAFT_301278 [Xylariaceae sp. FL0594]|nr:hypothetical protein F5Y17DRAFT_301278 [Xylariaceae sp. FL0594]
MVSTGPFTLQAEPGTDIWRKPPTTNIWNAPITRTSTNPIKKFRSARVTFWAQWTERYDQAGLLLVPRPASSSTLPPAKWLKTGVELYQGSPQLSTVGCDRYADWGIGPITIPPSNGGNGGITIEVVREQDEHGKSAWIYQLELDDRTGEVRRRVALREVGWIFADEEGDEEWLLDVSPLVARPERNVSQPLTVEFADFTVVWDE